MALVHPDMLTSLAAFYPQTCTFTQKAAGVDALGVPNGAPGNVAGLVSLSCSVNRPQRSTAPQESRSEERTLVLTQQVVALAGYYPAVTTKMQCVIEGAAFNVVAVNHDAQQTMTWVTVERVA